jgi:protein phosphatase 1G
VAAKFCAKYLHREVVNSEAYASGDLGTALQRAFFRYGELLVCFFQLSIVIFSQQDGVNRNYDCICFRMDEMMQGQRGWRELQALGDKINQFTGMIEGLIWSPKGSDSNDEHDDWAFEEVLVQLT